MWALAPDASPSTSAGTLCTNMTTATQARAGRIQWALPSRAGLARAITRSVRSGTGSADRTRMLRSRVASRCAKVRQSAQVVRCRSAAVDSSARASPSSRADSTSRTASHSMVTFHVRMVGGGGDLVPVLRHSTGMDHLTKLLSAARDGDRRALERFIAETQADVWRVCRYLGDSHD